MVSEFREKFAPLKGIDAQFPKPWQLGDRLIKINFTLWWELPIQERDLLLSVVFGRSPVGVGRSPFTKTKGISHRPLALK